MTWFTDPNNEAAAARELALIGYAADLTFPSGHVRLTTRKGGVTIGGNAFVPGYNDAGDLLVDRKEPTERSQLYAETWSYLLAGVDVTVIPESEIDNSYGGSALDYKCFFDPDTRALIGYEILEGIISNVRRIDGAEPLIEVNVENRLVFIEDADGHRYTGPNQDKFWPNFPGSYARDQGCDVTASVESKTALWGGRPVSPGIIADTIRARLRGGRG